MPGVKFSDMLPVTMEGDGEGKGISLANAFFADTLFLLEQGLVAGHSYAVLRLEFFTVRGQVFRLVQLRNPWGKSQVHCLSDFCSCFPVFST